VLAIREGAVPPFVQRWHRDQLPIFVRASQRFSAARDTADLQLHTSRVMKRQAAIIASFGHEFPEIRCEAVFGPTIRPKISVDSDQLRCLAIA